MMEDRTVVVVGFGVVKNVSRGGGMSKELTSGQIVPSKAWIDCTVVFTKSKGNTITSHCFAVNLWQHAGLDGLTPVGPFESAKVEVNFVLNKK